MSEVVVNYKCDKCNIGDLVRHGDYIFVTTHATQFQHRCGYCGHVKMLDHQYPKIIGHWEPSQSLAVRIG